MEVEVDVHIKKPTPCNLVEAATNQITILDEFGNTRNVADDIAELGILCHAEKFRDRLWKTRHHCQLLALMRIRLTRPRGRMGRRIRGQYRVNCCFGEKVVDDDIRERFRRQPPSLEFRSAHAQRFDRLMLKIHQCSWVNAPELHHDSRHPRLWPRATAPTVEHCGYGGQNLARKRDAYIANRMHDRVSHLRTRVTDLSCRVF